MDEIGFPELTIEQVATICERAEQAARSYVYSKVPTGRIVDLDVTVDAQGTKPITVDVDVNIVLSPLMKDFDVEELTKQATQQAFNSIEEDLRELKCKSSK